MFFHPEAPNDDEPCICSECGKKFIFTDQGPNGECPFCGHIEEEDDQ